MSGQGLKRDFQQIMASLWRMGVTIQRRKLVLLHIFCPLITAITAFWLILPLYSPDKLKLYATDQPWVTSTTPNADTNNFFDSSSGFNTHLNLANCTLTQSFWIGLVQEDTSGNTDGYSILTAAFDELNEAYKSAHITNGFELKIKEFKNNEELESYVKNIMYAYGEKICFALQWDQFLPDQNTFIIDLRWHYGDFLVNRKLQTEYEESLQSQLFLPEYAQTGFLQAMTTLTSQIISKQYKKSNYAFQLMYMPMNSPYFYNDNFSEVMGALLGLTIYIASNLASRFIEYTGDFDEKRIQQKLQRLGMRKSVELWLETLLTFGFQLVLIPLLCWMSTSYVLKTTDFWFFAVNMGIYAQNVTILSHMLKFLIDGHVLAESVEKTVEILQIVLIFFSYLLVEINPTFVLISVFLLPLPHINWVITLAEIAKNKSINVSLGQSNPIVNGNDLTTIMYVALLSWGLKMLVLVYLWPIKIHNDPKDRSGFFYPCTSKFYRQWCCKREERRNRMNAQPIDPDLSQNMLQDGAKEEALLKLEGVTVVHKKHVFACKKHRIIDDLSLEVRKDEIFVVIGENGSGKSAILQTIAGLTHIHHGTATAYGVDLFNSLRFTMDNFLSIVPQKEALIDNMTPEEQIRFSCRFMGITDIENTLENILTQFDLKMCSGIITRRCSNVQRKSLSLALSLMGHSKIVLLDEPTAGMDVASKREFWELIQAHKKNKIIILATQDMQEACALGTRIGFLSRGKMTSQFIVKELKHTLQLVFKINNRQTLQNQNSKKLLDQTAKQQEEELQKVVQEAMLPAFQDKLTEVDMQWNYFDQLIVRLGSDEKLHDCIDLDRLNDIQGLYFKIKHVINTPFDETFAEIITHVQHDQTEAFQIDDRHLTSSSVIQAFDEVPNQGYTKVTFYQSLTALLKTEFYLTNLWRKMGFIFGISLIILGHETILISVFLLIPQRILNYNDVETIWEKNGPPILAFSNSLLPDMATSTGALTSLYLETVNAHVEQVILEDLDIQGQNYSVAEWMSEAASSFQEAAENAAESGVPDQEGEKKEAYGAYFIYQMNEATNNYSIGVYGNQAAAASCPTFGATMLNTLAQKITGQNSLKIEFRNKMLPINNDLFPSEKPIVAEIFAVSVSAATIYLMTLQSKWHGKPVNSGFYEAYLLKGGFPRAYLCSKYLKAVCSNLVMILVLFIFIFGMKFCLFASLTIGVVWAFVNPLFVLVSSNVWTINFNMDYRFVQQQVLLCAIATGIFAYITAGAIAFSQHRDIGYLWTSAQLAMIITPTILFQTVSFGLLFTLDQILEHENQTSMNLNEFKSWYFEQQMGWLAVNFVFWGSILLISSSVILKFTRRTLKYVKPLNHIEATNTAQDVVKEQQQVDQIVKQDNLKDDTVLTVQNLQCWKFLNWQEVGLVVRGNNSIVVVNKDLLGFFSVRGVSLSVKKDQRVVLLSGNSSGATSLIQSVLGIQMIIKGGVTIQGCEEISSRKNRIHYHELHGIVGYQPQRDSIDDDLTVMQHLKLFSKLAGINRTDRQSEIKAILQACCLEDIKDKKPEDLTPGQIKRLSLGMALIGRPQLLILDNPLTGVDPITKKKLVKTILKWSEGRSLLMVTTDVEECELITDKVGIMHQGKLLAVGSVKEIIKTHGKGYTLEIQADMDKINMQAKLVKDQEIKETMESTETTETTETTDTTFSSIRTSCDARYLLKRIISILDKNKESRWAGLLEEFSPNGLLQDLVNEIDLYGYSTNKFIYRILILNLAFTLIDEMLEFNPRLDLNIDFAYSAVLRISVKPTTRDFNLADFTEYVSQLVRNRAVTLSTLYPNTIETVFSRLIQSAPFQAEKIKEAITKKHARASTLAFRRESINKNDNQLIYE